MSDYDNLIAIGYTMGERHDGPAPVAPGNDVVGGKWSRTVSSTSDQRMGHMNGRLSNLAYMAKAIDEYDGVVYGGPDREDFAQGKQQFDHLMSRSGLKGIGLTYMALRRIQRAGNLVALRVGLTILLALDHDEISASDALAALDPSLLASQDAQGMTALIAPTIGLPAA
jgi:hypothetical protein